MVHQKSKEEDYPQEQKWLSGRVQFTQDFQFMFLSHLLQWDKPEGEAGTDSHCRAWRRSSETDRVHWWVYTEN